MYATGRCPDVGFSLTGSFRVSDAAQHNSDLCYCVIRRTVAGRQTPSPLLLYEYLQQRVQDEAEGIVRCDEAGYVDYLKPPETNTRQYNIHRVISPLMNPQ